MTRYVVAYEGKPMRDGRFIEKGALRVNRDFIPVTLGYNYSEIVGRASGFERDEETGAISFEIETAADVSEMVARMSANVFASDVVSEGNGIEMRIHSAVIREITFLAAAFAWD